MPSSSKTALAKKTGKSKTGSPLVETAKPRLSRAEKRAQQRIANIGRAQKMHDARLAYLKEHPSVDVDRTIAGENLSAPQFYIGCSGWYYWDWKGTFYPSDLPSNRWFDHYMQSFETVELNAPFYSWPTLATVKTWIRQAASKPFVYTIKVSELITHVKRFEGTKTLVKDFGLIADLLGERMGCFLYQLPPSYQYSAARLHKILSQLDASRRNVVEFRHASWWNTDVYAAFRKANVIFCSCSGPKLPDELIKTSDDVYVRFHGTKKWYRHDYGADELAIWAEKILSSGAKTAWLYFNNDYEGFAIKNAKEIAGLLKVKQDGPKQQKRNKAAK